MSKVYIPRSVKKRNYYRTRKRFYDMDPIDSRNDVFENPVWRSVRSGAHARRLKKRRIKRVKQTSLFSLPVLAGAAAVWYFFIRKPVV